MDAFLQLFEFEQIARTVLSFLPRLFAASVILLFFWFLYSLTGKSLRVVLRRAGFQEAMIHLLINNVYQVVLFIIGILMALSQLGVNVAAALTGLGVAGIAMGLAAQDTLANVIAGVVILWDQPFLVGDYVTTGGQYGRVTNITLRTTRIRTQENTYVVIPNRSIIDSVLVNHTKHGEIRVNITVGIAYKESIAEARRVILESLKQLPNILQDPPPEVVAEGFGASSVDLSVRVWIDDPFQERPTHFRVVEASKTALDDAGIQIPFPHLQLFIDDIEDRVLDKVAALPALRARGGSQTG
jgi:small-conductance mechanosensitive channel